MQEEFDIVTPSFNSEEWNLTEIVEEIKKALDKFVEMVDERPLVETPSGPMVRCGIVPDGDGESHFWVGGQV